MAKNNSLAIISGHIKKALFSSLISQVENIFNKIKRFHENSIKLGILIIAMVLFSLSLWFGICVSIFVLMMHFNYGLFLSLLVVNLINLLGFLICFRLMIPIKKQLSLTGSTNKLFALFE